MNIQYIGEHLLPGDLGRIFIWLSFISSLIAAGLFAMIFFKKSGNRKLLRGARGLYLLHTLSLLAVASILYYLIFGHYFEYSYVWQYSSKTLQVKYIISCFWAGQEGSFLVWALWQALTGLVLIVVARDWESPVMFIVSLSQVFVTSMLLGVKLSGVRIGSSPFELLRDSMGSSEGTIFQMPNYLTMISDGNGLNPLLENIWMTIHPPILFLGYALALVPFAYAMASLMRKDYHTWITRAIPWSLASLLLLGAGILLGGAWAYVSLTFGGFWTWDPVENSSLVPWMTLLAGLHLLIISRRQNYALIGSYIMLAISYVLVLYASYLTRSGVLADTSAHSFGDNGMTSQLLVFLLTFTFLSILLIGTNARKIGKIKNDNLFSREFWMFIGSVVVVLAAFQVIFTTSIPVFNAIFGTEMAPPADTITFYNRWQSPFILLIAAFIAFSQVLNYNPNEPSVFLRKIWIPLLAALVITTLLALTDVVVAFNWIMLVFFLLTALFASVNNLTFQKTKPVNTGAVITHIGFVLFALGAVITFSNSKVISSNTSQYDLGDEKKNSENLVLMKNDTVYMNGYYVTYNSTKTEGNTTIYKVDFLKSQGRSYVHDFSLHPSVNVHPRMGAVYNPDTRHFTDRDFYTFISMVSKDPDYIVIKAIMNPYINVLWIGCVVMLTGFAISWYRRIRRLWLVRGR